MIVRRTVAVAAILILLHSLASAASCDLVCMIEGTGQLHHHMHDAVPKKNTSQHMHSHHSSTMTEHGGSSSFTSANVFLISGASTMPGCRPALVASPRFKAEDGRQVRHLIDQAPRIFAHDIGISEFDGSFPEDLGPPVDNPAFSVLRI